MHLGIIIEPNSTRHQNIHQTQTHCLNTISQRHMNYSNILLQRERNITDYWSVVGRKQFILDSYFSEMLVYISSIFSKKNPLATIIPYLIVALYKGHQYRWQILAMILVANYSVMKISHDWWHNHTLTDKCWLETDKFQQWENVSALSQVSKYLKIGTYPASQKLLSYMGKHLIYTRNIKIFTCPPAWGTRKYERTSAIFEACK